MTTEKTSSPRRSGADWFGLVAFAVLVICSAVLVVRLISTKFLPTGQLLLAVGALLVLSGLHGWVQLPHREKTGGKIACGIVALVLAAAMLYGAVALGSVQHAITDVADKSVETDITCVIVNADDPAQSLDDVKGYRFGILEDRDTENTQSLLQQLRGRLQGRPWVTVTWFVPDEKKAGGNCVTTTGQAIKLREQPPALLLSEGEEIPLERMLALELIENPG